MKKGDIIYIRTKVGDEIAAGYRLIYNDKGDWIWSGNVKECDLPLNDKEELCKCKEWHAFWFAKNGTKVCRECGKPIKPTPPQTELPDEIIITIPKGDCANLVVTTLVKVVNQILRHLKRPKGI